MYWVGMRLLIRRLIQFVSGAALASRSTCTSGGVIDSVADTNKPDSKLHRKQSCVSVQWTELQINMASHPHPAAGVSVDRYFGLNHFTLPVRLPDTFFPSSCGCHLHHTPTFSSIKAVSATVLCDVAPTVCQEN